VHKIQKQVTPVQNTGKGISCITETLHTELGNPFITAEENAMYGCWLMATSAVYFDELCAPLASGGGQ
jgi:hypothetical protein